MEHELHWAAQLASAPGNTLLAKKSDDSQANLGWDRTARALAGHPVSGKRAALRLGDAVLLVLDDASGAIGEKPLAGETLDSALAWLAQRFEAPALGRPLHELPPHPLASGARFTTGGSPELARLYALADEVLSPIATPVRCWPHHFDIACLIAIGGERTIGVGLSPGDASYGEPYWYVTPWPYPTGDLPPLAHGKWHRDGWTGAVLVAREGEPQPFLDEAVATARALHESG